MHYLLPFSTYHANDPDFDAADHLAETRRLFERQQVISQFLEGGISAEDFLDLLEAHEIDVQEYAVNVSKGVDLVIRQSIPVEGF